MKIALIGFGKMGHMLRDIALQRNNEVVAVLDPISSEEGVLTPEEGFVSEAFRSADVVIEFTTPATAEANVRRCIELGKAVVCGSTGWDCTAMKQLAIERHVPFIWTSNFSLGVNILFAMNARLAEIMQEHKEYTPSMTEVHHIHKLDHPSGTAKTLAAQIPGFNPDTIESVREGEVPGIHTVVWDSKVDTITLSHSAKSREGFALGAVLAAEWIPGKPGWHTMKEVLGL